MGDSGNFEKGKDLLKQLHGGKDFSPPFESVFPDYWKMTVENDYGAIWSRPGLALRERSMITLAVLISRMAGKGLKSQIRNALSIGISKEEILEIIMHVSYYAGCYTGPEALLLAKEVFSEKEK
ncbi:MAG: carboxymuconolactone decarboxylase family protein [Chloroflexi bacterium]|nr:carboxymuconolactone decarboxylase family protein [Chloroflexota bacterium]